MSYHALDLKQLPSPCFVVSTDKLRENLAILKEVGDASGAKVLLALKAFSMFSVASLVDEYLAGTCASEPYEARLGREQFSGEVHTFSAAYSETDIKEVLLYSDHVVFNSFNQWLRFRSQCLQAQEKRPSLRFGLRINPEHSEGATAIYDPCAPCSRLGIPLADFTAKTKAELSDDLMGISGLHFHTLCEQDFLPLSRTLDVIEEKFGHLIKQMEWVNFGGGHHITREDYQRQDLIKRVKAFRKKYQVEVIIEPGEAIALDAGVLVGEVLDIKDNGMPLAILNVSATCHMPDVIEMPYRPNIINAGKADEKAYTYRLGGQTCLAGDVIGDYSFDKPLEIGDKLVFLDMAIYTMVKTNTFNGMPLPSIATWDSENDKIEVVKTFSYQNFKNRLS